MDEDSPIIKCLPPETDYIDYLTILEYNVNRENLQILHEVLQDVALTSNIGWDLLHILLPLLPESLSCLETVSCLGNPREVLLKATEALRTIKVSQEDGSDGNESDDEKSEKEEQKSSNEVCIPVQQFSVLVNMLDVLQSRIKTQYPSRFISTTFQAILSIIRQWKLLHYELFDKNRTLLIENVFPLIKSRSKKIPVLPPRTGSNEAVVFSAPRATDPEAYSEPITAEEEKNIVRLYQSFLTELVELYVSDSIDEKQSHIPGMAWSIRLQVELDGRRTVSGDKDVAMQFSTSESLSYRYQGIMDRFCEISSSLAMTDHALVTDVVGHLSSSGISSDQKFSGKSPDVIPLSALGSLYLLTARRFNHQLSDGIHSMGIFPGHAIILRRFLGSDNNLAMIGSEPLCIIDAVLALGLLALDDIDCANVPEDDFLQYLQTMSLLSANTPHASLRYYAHLIASSVLASHPSDAVQSAFISDTLKECPFENLQTIAIGWLKDEIIKTNQTEASANLFTLPDTLRSFAIAIFVPPDLASDIQLEDKWITLKAKFSFHLAALNFYYLLLSSDHLREHLQVVKVHQELDMAGKYLKSLDQVLMDFKGLEDLDAKFDLTLLGDVLDRIFGKLDTLGWAGKPLRDS